MFYANRTCFKALRAFYEIITLHFPLTFLHRCQRLSELLQTRGSASRHWRNSKLISEQLHHLVCVPAPVMRYLALRLCYSIMVQLMKKTTSSLLTRPSLSLPKIRFPLIKCHRWRRASSDLTKVSPGLPPLQMRGVARVSPAVPEMKA